MTGTLSILSKAFKITGFNGPINYKYAPPLIDKSFPAIYYSGYECAKDRFKVRRVKAGQSKPRHGRHGKARRGGDSQGLFS
jgi:hypothetical protein